MCLCRSGVWQRNHGKKKTIKEKFEFQMKVGGQPQCAWRVKPMGPKDVSDALGQPTSFNGVAVQEQRMIWDISYYSIFLYKLPPHWRSLAAACSGVMSL